MRKWLFLILALLVVALAATRLPRSARTAVKADQVKLLCVSAGGVYWVDQAPGGGATLLHAARVGAAPRTLASAPSITSLAAAGKSLVYLTEDKTPSSGQLWQAGPGSAPPRSLRQGLRAPRGLLATREHLYWVETRPAPVPGIACVPVLQPLSLIYRANLDGEAPALLAVSESDEAHFPGRLMGERDGQLYWLQHSGQQYQHPITTVSRVPVQGGPAEQMARAEGLQEALVVGSTLYWTAPSEEISPPGAGRSVRCLPLAGGEARTLTDWLSPRGALGMIGGRVVYCDQTTVWRIPSRLGEAQPVAKFAQNPDCLTIYNGAVYTPTTTPEGGRLMRRPLTLGARLRGLMGQ